jgi:hypothetical protein
MPDEITESTQDNTEVVEVTTTPETSIETESTNDQATEPTTTEQLGAPEQYTEFTVPENFSAPIDDFKTWAKENNMTQEKAQSTVDFYTNKIAPQMQAQHEVKVAEWVTESTTKYGKDGIEAANKALSRFSTPEFTAFLQETGLGNYHEMIGIFKNINSKISESSFVDSKTTESKPKTLGQIMYPDMK